MNSVIVILAIGIIGILYVHQKTTYEYATYCDTCEEKREFSAQYCYRCGNSLQNKFVEPEWDGEIRLDLADLIIPKNVEIIDNREFKVKDSCEKDIDDE